MGYIRLGQLRVNDYPAVSEVGPEGARKATVKMRRNPKLRILPFIYLFLFLFSKN